MKIAVWHNLPSGGAKRALSDQVRGLIARGHELDAWCPPTADRSYLPLSDLVREHVVPLALTSHLTSPSRALKPASLLEKLHPLHWSARLRMAAMNRHSRQCAREINARGFDLLFAASCMLFHTPPIARFVKIPRVLYLQEPNRPFYECSPELPWVATSWEPRDLSNPGFWRRSLLRRLKLPGIRVLAREERANAMAFDQILVNSLFSRESLLRSLGVDSKVCYLGIDPNRFVNHNHPRDTFAVCLAALLPPKNIEFLIASLAKVARIRCPKLVLIANMVDETYLKRLFTLAAQTGVHIELKYRAEDSELIDLLNRAHVMLYAPRLEPFGYAPLEANACGLPVIAVAEGGVRETIVDGVNGLLVEHDPQSMADAIERLVVDAQLHQRLSRQALGVVRTKWALDSSVDRLERVLQQRTSQGHSQSRPLKSRADSALAHSSRV